MVEVACPFISLTPSRGQEICPIAHSLQCNYSCHIYPPRLIVFFHSHPSVFGIQLLMKLWPLSQTALLTPSQFTGSEINHWLLLVPTCLKLSFLAVINASLCWWYSLAHYCCGADLVKLETSFSLLTRICTCTCCLYSRPGPPTWHSYQQIMAGHRQKVT